jgi:DNA end-binding protein Ku
VAPRAYWKGYLKLSLVSCPVALFPASSEREKISFNQINKKTGNRIRYRKVDAETGEEIDSSDIIKGYEVGKGQSIEIGQEELEAIAIESKRTIEIDEFVPNTHVDHGDPLDHVSRRTKAGGRDSVPLLRRRRNIVLVATVDGT